MNAQERWSDLYQFIEEKIVVLKEMTPKQEKELKKRTSRSAGKVNAQMNFISTQAELMTYQEVKRRMDRLRCSDE